MTANIFSVNDLIVVLFFVLVFIGVPITVLVIAIRAIVRRHKTWEEVKDQDEGQ